MWKSIDFRFLFGSIYLGSGALDMNIDLTKLFKKSHLGKWVAVTLDNKKVVGFGKTPKEALLSAKNNGYISEISLMIASDNYANIYP